MCYPDLRFGSILTPLTPDSLFSHNALCRLFNENPNGIALAETGWVSGSVQPDAESDATLTLVGAALTLYQLQGAIASLHAVVSIGAFRLHPLSGKYQDTVVIAPVTIHKPDELKALLSRIAEDYRIEVAIQRQQPVLADGGLLVMDMDSTLIQIECIDEIAKLTGLGAKVAEVTAKAMRGELAFNDSLISRVGCLKGVNVGQLEKIRNNIPLMPGIMPLLNELQANNWKVAIASGGFTFFADYLKERLGVDHASSNTLGVDGDRLNGEVVGEIVDAQVKARLVRTLSSTWHIPPSQTVAMGDGANDLVMMAEAALGVACHAKPVVVEQADVAIRFGGLHNMLYLLK